MSPSRLGVGAVAIAVVSWGVGDVLIKKASSPGLVFSFWRLWAGLVAMCAIQAVVGRPFSWRAFRATFVPGLLFGLNVAVFFSAIKLTSVANATLIPALQPALVLLVAGRWFGEKVTRRDTLWTVVAIVGVGAVVLGSAGTPVWSPLGDFLAVVALVIWTAYFLISKRFREKLEPFEFMSGTMLWAAIVVTPLAFLSGQDLTAVQGADWIYLAGFVLVSGCGGHLLLLWAHPHVDVSVSSVILVGVPVVSAVGALLILGEPLRAGQIVGGLGVVVAIAMVASRPVERTEALAVPE